MRSSFVTLTVLVLLGSSATAQETPIEQFIKNDAIQDPDSSVSFRLRSGWTLSKAARWGDHETTLWFTEAGSQITAALYYQYPLQQQVPSDTDAVFREAVGAKVRQRQREGMTDYRIRPGSVQTRVVGGYPAMSFVGEFTKDGQARIEYMVRVLAKNTKAHFFVIGPAGPDTDAFLKRLEPIVETLRIP